MKSPKSKVKSQKSGIARRKSRVRVVGRVRPSANKVKSLKRKAGIAKR